MENMVDQIRRQMIDYYAGKDTSQIAHTLCVHEYTRTLAVQEQYDPRQIILLEIAALLHDVGCPISKELYGNSLPVNQEREGAKITSEWLGKYGELSEEEVKWITDTVGAHHQFAKARELGFETLFEADLIVNLFEGYYKKENARTYFDKLVTTSAGRGLFTTLFLM